MGFGFRPIAESFLCCFVRLLYGFRAILEVRYGLRPTAVPFLCGLYGYHAVLCSLTYVIAKIAHENIGTCYDIHNLFKTTKTLGLLNGL